MAIRMAMAMAMGMRMRMRMAMGMARGMVVAMAMRGRRPGPARLLPADNGHCRPARPAPPQGPPPHPWSGRLEDHV